jgi:uncharacterized BrkB/YihY/UPF0761 family membrane protein
MKKFWKDIKYCAKLIATSVIVMVVVIGSLTLFLAVPDILEWISGYIGTLMTYGLFISGMLLFIAYCINHAK